jgi:octaprenyl-diphosphate synthase
MKASASREALLKQRVSTAIGAELRAIDELIATHVGSAVGLIREIGGFVAGPGGRRLRPILLLMAARLAGYRGPRVAHMGCVLELLHTATLVHDDVVDHAPLRRGRPSVNARWGDDASVLVGDYLYAKAFALMVQDRDLRVLETLAAATVSMTEAEVFRLERKRARVTTEADYLQVVTQKTASLIAACCRIGGLLAECPPDRLEGLTRYGLDIGVALQISDDSLDFVADHAQAVGAHLRDGKITLPLIAALDRAGGPERDRVQQLLGLPALDAEQVEEIRLLVMKHKGVEYALDRAHVFAQNAKSALSAFPESTDRETLAVIADFVVDRDR